jgi:hypothetical protein
MAVAESKIREMIDHVKQECSIIDREERFRQMLDECYSFDSVGGPFAYMVPSKVLEEMDPTAFRCAVNDYIDGEETYEIDGETYDQREVDEAKDEFIEELEAEISALEEERDEWVKNEGGDDDEQDRTDEEWAEEFPDEAEELIGLQAALEACQKYSF